MYYKFYLLRLSSEINLSLFLHNRKGKKKEFNVIIMLNDIFKENIHLKEQSSRTVNEKIFSCEVSKYKSKCYQIF